MNIDEIKAAAVHLSRQAAYWQHQLGEKTVSEPEIVARALLAALPVVEAAQTVSRKAIVILDFHEQGTTVELDLMHDALAAFDKAIEELKP